MSRTMLRWLAALLALTLLAAACGDDDDGGDTGSDDTVEDGGDSGDADGGDDGGDAADIDYEAIGLWDDGPCDEAMEPLKVGLMTTFESAVISLGDQAVALEAAAEAFNNRGGANGACIEVVTCDDGANVDQAIACVRELDEAGVVVTVNDQGTAGQAEVSEAMAAAGIPRVAGNVTNFDWGDPNTYPMDASGTGSTFMMPKGLIEAGVSEIGIIRVDSPGAGALLGLLEGVFEGEATFPVDVPVPAGTTDFSQFVLAAQDGGAGGVALAIGEQEAVQVVRAAEQLGSDLRIGATLGTFSHSAVTDFGDFAEQMVFVWSFPPATADLPIYEALRADMEASGEEGLQVENLKASPMRSWIGLFGLLQIIRESGATEFTREGMTTMLQESGPVPMAGIFGGEDWEPDKSYEGLFQRAGIPRWAAYEWDPSAEAPAGLEGNWVEIGSFNFDEVLCETPIGPPTCG